MLQASIERAVVNTEAIMHHW